MLSSRDKRIFEAVRMAKEWIESEVRNTIRSEFTHAQMLQCVDKYKDTDWFKCVPDYRRYEVRGYREALISSTLSPLYRNVRCALLFEGELYISFDEWRSTHPTGDPKGLSNVSVWASGKVFFGESSGYTIDWHTPKE